MSQTVFGAPAVVTMLNRAFNNASPANAVFNNQVATAGTTVESQTAFALQFGNSFAGLSDAALSAQVLGNLGVLPNAELEAAVTQYFADNGLANRGLVVLQLGQILSTLETAPAPQDIFNAAAAAWNNEVEQSFVYSSNAANTTAFNGDFPVVPVNQGQTFTLTANVDNIQGTSGNDTIVAGEGSSGGVHTLGASDVVNGGAGTDTIDIKLVGHALTPRMSNVEKVFAQALGVGDAINMVNTTGVQELWSNNSTSNLAVTNLQEKATIGVKGGNGSNYTVQAAATARTGDLAIALDTAHVGNLFVNSTGAAGGAGYTSTTINAATGTNAITGLAGTGANEIGTLDVGATLATVTVTGDGAVRVTNDLAATVRTIDASANKGGANFNITTNTGNVTFTGGEGADRINFGGTLNLADKVDGGAGRDILGVASQASIVTGLQVSNTEILELATLNDALNAALVAGADEVRVTTTLADVSGTAVVNGLSSNSTFVTNDSGDVRLNITNAQVAGTNDTLNLKTGIAAGGFVNVQAAGVETVAYTQNNLAAAGANTNLAFYDTDGVVDMTKLTLANTAGNTVQANFLVNTIKTVDASAAMGAVQVSVNAGNPTSGVEITGGAGADRLIGGDGKDIIVAGAGNDTVSGDQFIRIPGTGGPAIAQQSTLSIANAEVGDVFNINGTNVTWTGVEATNNAAVIAAAATAGVTITADVLADAAAGTFTLVGANTGAAFALPVVAATNVAAQPGVAEVSTVTIATGYVPDADDAIGFSINGIAFNGTAGQTVAQQTAAIVAAVNAAGQMTAASAVDGAGNTVITLTGTNAATNYVVAGATLGANAAQVQAPQITTLNIGTAEAGDVFTINGTNVVWTGVEATDNAAVIAAAATAGVTITADVLADGAAGTFTMTGAADGTPFAAPVVASTNFAGTPAVTAVSDFIATTATDLVTVGGGAVDANEVTYEGATYYFATGATVAATAANIQAAIQAGQGNANVTVTATAANTLHFVDASGAAAVTPGIIDVALSSGGTAAVPPADALDVPAVFTPAAAAVASVTNVAFTDPLSLTSFNLLDTGVLASLFGGPVAIIAGSNINTIQAALQAAANAGVTVAVNGATGLTITNAAGTGIGEASLVSTGDAAVATEVAAGSPVTPSSAAVDFDVAEINNLSSFSVTVGGAVLTVAPGAGPFANDAALAAALQLALNAADVGFGADLVVADTGVAGDGTITVSSVTGRAFTAAAVLDDGTPVVAGAAVVGAVVPVTAGAAAGAPGANTQTIDAVLTAPGSTVNSTANDVATTVVLADNAPTPVTPAGADTQGIVANTTVVGQASGDQFITGAATADTLTGGAGNDNFWVLSGSNGLMGTSFTTMDTITDLNLGGATLVLGVDRVVLSAATFAVFGATDLINAGTALAMTGPNLAGAVQALFNAGGALNGSLNDVGLFTYGADTYLVATDNVVGLNPNDVIIKVTGVSGTLDLSDIVLA